MLAFLAWLFCHLKVLNQIFFFFKTLLTYTQLSVTCRLNKVGQKTERVYGFSSQLAAEHISYGFQCSPAVVKASDFVLLLLLYCQTSTSTIFHRSFSKSFIFFHNLIHSTQLSVMVLSVFYTFTFALGFVSLVMCILA